MNTARLLLAAGLLLMIAACVWAGAFASGENDIIIAIRAMVAEPWGAVTLVDLYLGFAIIGGWIVYREASALRSIPWLIAMCFLGNIAAMVYLLLSLRGVQSRGDLDRFFHGHRLEVRTQ